MTAGHLRKPTGEPATLACRLIAGISQASWRGGSLGRSHSGPGWVGQGRGGGVSGRSVRGPGGRGRGSRGPRGSQRGDGGAGAGCAAARGPAGEEGDRGPHRGPRAVGRASRPSAGSAGPSRGCRRSGPPGRSRHISPPHPGSPPWLAPSSVSCGSAATRGGSRRRRGGEAGRGWGACGGERGGAQATAAERRRPQRRGPGALAGSRLRLLSAASPPPAGGYGSSRIPPGPRTDLPGPTARADSAVPAWRGPARGRPTWGAGGRAIPGRLPAGGFRRGGDPTARSGSAVPPDLPGRPARAAARLPIAAGRRVGSGTSVFRKIPRDRRPRLWAPSLGRIPSDEDRASGTGVQEAQESFV